MKKLVLLLQIILMLGMSSCLYYFDRWHLKKGMPSEFLLRLKVVGDGTRVFDGDPEPKWPKNHDDTIEGVDSDQDGVRDDMEIWINERFQTYNERMAWKDYSKALQIYLMHGAIDNVRKHDQTWVCIGVIYGYPRNSYHFTVLDQFDYSYFDTLKRYQSYELALRQVNMDGTYSDQSDKLLKTIGSKVCNFEIESLDKILEVMKVQHRSYYDDFQKGQQRQLK